MGWFFKAKPPGVVLKEPTFLFPFRSELGGTLKPLVIWWRFPLSGNSGFFPPQGLGPSKSPGGSGLRRPVGTPCVEGPAKHVVPPPVLFQTRGSPIFFPEKPFPFFWFAPSPGDGWKPPGAPWRPHPRRRSLAVAPLC